MGIVVHMPRSQSKLAYLSKIRTKIPGGANITKYFKRKPKKLKKSKTTKPSKSKK
jgi:hypothetical protein